MCSCLKYYVLFVFVAYFSNCLQQWTVCGQTGVIGATVTSIVVPELGHEPDRAPTLLLHMVVTTVRGRHKKRQSVY